LPDGTDFFDRLQPVQDAVLREMAALDTGFDLTLSPGTAVANSKTASIRSPVRLIARSPRRGC